MGCSSVGTIYFFGGAFIRLLLRDPEVDNMLFMLKAANYIGIIIRVQKSYCDAFDVGRQLIAYHPEVWEKKEWIHEYLKIKFSPKVEVEMVENGVFN